MIRAIGKGKESGDESPHSLGEYAALRSRTGGRTHDQPARTLFRTHERRTRSKALSDSELDVRKDMRHSLASVLTPLPERSHHQAQLVAPLKTLNANHSRQRASNACVLSLHAVLTFHECDSAILVRTL